MNDAHFKIKSKLEAGPARRGRPSQLAEAGPPQDAPSTPPSPRVMAPPWQGGHNWRPYLQPRLARAESIELGASQVDSQPSPERRITADGEPCGLPRMPSCPFFGAGVLGRSCRSTGILVTRLRLVVVVVRWPF
jgi:hypothetical protein